MKHKKKILIREPCLVKSPISLQEKSELMKRSPFVHPDFVVLAVEAFAQTQAWEECLEILGENEDDIQLSKEYKPLFPAEKELDVMSLICMWRGRTFIGLDHRTDPAKFWLRKAVELDSHNYEAFDLLLKYDLLSGTESLSLVSNLDFGKHLWLKELYLSKIKKVNPLLNQKISTSLEYLKQNGLGESVDVLHEEAELLYFRNEFRQAYSLCEKILDIDPYNPDIINVYLALLIQLKKDNELFSFAHKLSEQSPGSTTTWYAIGCYYYSIRSFETARQFFGKATTANPLYGAAWLAYGHSFAMQGEHDQAMAAYRTGTRALTGCHLLPLFIGMEAMTMNNFDFAAQYLNQSKELNSKDPMIFNELGVVAFRKKEYSKAVTYFTTAIDLCGSFLNEFWEPTLFNLGHGLRKLNRFPEALSYYQKALDLNRKNPSTLVAIAFTYSLSGEFEKAVNYYHQALVLKPDDNFASEMLIQTMNAKLSQNKIE